MELVLVRHGESVWNQANRFTGWEDVELSEKGQYEAQKAGVLLKDYGYSFDIAYTSYLKRAIHTTNIILDEMDLNWIGVQKTWRLNERHYGALQGLNKAETSELYGDDQVKQWRRSYDTIPPLLENQDKRNPRWDQKYKEIHTNDLPLGESLELTIARAVPYYQQVIHRVMLSGRKILIVAHGNSLRGLIMYMEHISKEDIVSLNIPTGVPMICRFDTDGNFLERFILDK